MRNIAVNEWANPEMYKLVVDLIDASSALPKEDRESFIECIRESAL